MREAALIFYIEEKGEILYAVHSSENVRQLY